MSRRVVAAVQVQIKETASLGEAEAEEKVQSTAPVVGK
jgi:hypothetical protein